MFINMTDDEMKLFIKNQVERQTEWRNLFIKQKKERIKNKNKEMNSRSKDKTPSLEDAKL
jgi:hypothetical protein